jgi:hypothetical protein
MNENQDSRQTLRGALEECRRLADASKEGFEEDQHKVLAAIYSVANDALSPDSCPHGVPYIDDEDGICNRCDGFVP